MAQGMQEVKAVRSIGEGMNNLLTRRIRQAKLSKEVLERELVETQLALIRTQNELVLTRGELQVLRRNIQHLAEELEAENWTVPD